MRAAIMISSLAMAGAERNIVSVAPHIRGLGVELYLISLNTRRDSALAKEFAQTGIPRIDVGAKHMTELAAVRRFLRVLRDEQIDLVHAQDQDTIVYAALAHAQLGLPTVMSRHVLVEPQDTLKERIRAQMVLVAARNGFDRIIAVAEAVRHNFAELAGVPLHHIETIYNGLDPDRFLVNTPKSELRQQLGWHPYAPTVIMVGALRRGKGHDLLFEALPYLIEQVPGLQVKLVGDGELAAEVQRQVRRHISVVEWLGNRPDVPRLLAASDVLTLPSWAEALPNVLIEAGAAGLPTVATAVGGVAEIVIDNETGYLVSKGDAHGLANHLIWLLNNKTLAENMGVRARLRIRRYFSLGRQARQTVELYHRVVSR